MTSNSLSRRAFLASAVSASVAGCNGVQYRDRYEPGERVSLTVSAPPADDDEAATTIARTLTDRLSSLGVDAVFEPKGRSQLYLDALINHDFDVFVGRYPNLTHPDALYPLLHSSFAPEPGWQNPFGVTSVAIDDALEALRESADSTGALREFLDVYVERVPFSVVTAPDFLTVRREELAVPDGATTEQPLDLLAQLASTSLDRAFRAGIFSVEITENRNPLAGEFRWNNQLLGLVYDSLARPSRNGPGFIPWAARDWYFEDGDLVVELRPGQTFHDGSQLTAQDVAFTLRLLSDTSLGEAPSPVPATRFRGHTTLVSDAEATDERTVRFEVADHVDPVNAERVLRVPILPEAEWADRTELVEERVTKALVWENRQPVGSGPLAFEEATPEESVRFRPYESHFLGDTNDDRLTKYAPALDAAGVVARYAPSGEDALVALGDGRLDTSLDLFPLQAIGGVEGANDVVSASSPSDELCIVGYNFRRAPLSDFRFRQVLARLHDREHTAASVFDGFARATDLPMVEDWHEVDWSSEFTVGSFPGSDGELDVSTARDRFEEAGYTYDDDGNLFR
jgi:peptide/nickel transport system substrate-binding protein